MNRDPVIRSHRCRLPLPDILGAFARSILGLTVFFIVQLVADDIPLVGFFVGYLLAILTQLLMMVFVLAISRYREYVADEETADYTGDPDALVRALATIHEVGTH